MKKIRELFKRKSIIPLAIAIVFTYPLFLGAQIGYNKVFGNIVVTAVTSSGAITAEDVTANDDLIATNGDIFATNGTVIADGLTIAGQGSINGTVTLGTNDVDDITVNGPTIFKVRREDFNADGTGPYFDLRAGNWGDGILTDTGTNYMFLFPSELSFVFYRWEQAFGGAVDPIQDGYLLFDIDDTENDGIDIAFNWFRAAAGGSRGRPGWDEDLDSTAYCEVSVKIADISETDSFYFGWSLQEAVIDAGNWAGGNTFAYFVLSDALGDLDIVTQLNAGGGVENDDTGVTWADGNEKVLRVTIAANTVSFSIGGTDVTQTLAVLDFDNGDMAGCVAGWLNAAGDATPDPDISFNYVEIGISQ